jgi:hypothetical protein
MVFFDGRGVVFLIGITFESVTVCPENGSNNARRARHSVFSFSHDGRGKARGGKFRCIESDISFAYKGLDEVIITTNFTFCFPVLLHQSLLFVSHACRHAL